MPDIIRNGAIVADDWLPVAEQADSGLRQLLTLNQWCEAGRPGGAGVQLEPAKGCEELLAHLNELAVIAVHFPIFTDGRGFSCARKLRDNGFKGELRAQGDFLPDQLHYLRRCGFNAFELAQTDQLDVALERLRVFSDDYQASIDQPVPLFRRRA